MIGKSLISKIKNWFSGLRCAPEKAGYVRLPLMLFSCVAIHGEPHRLEVITTRCLECLTPKEAGWPLEAEYQTRVYQHYRHDNKPLYEKKYVTEAEAKAGHYSLIHDLSEKGIAALGENQGTLKG